MTIKAENLRINQTVLVTGVTAFSRVASLIVEPELSRRVRQSRERGSLYPTTVPHTTISITDAQVSPAGDTLTDEEQFVAEKCFVSKSGENMGKTGFSIDDKSSYLPIVFAPDPDNPGSHRQVVLPNDLAAGLKVTLVLGTFQSGDYAKKGLGLQQIILHEEPRYYVQGIDTDALAARGIIITGPVQPVPGTGIAPEGAELPANTQADPESGLPMPGPGSRRAAPGAPAQPGPQVLTKEQQIARLKAEIVAEQNAGQGRSAFDGQSQEDIDPWAGGEAAGADHSG